MLPLQLGVPGGPELLVILLISVLLLGLPVLLVICSCASATRAGTASRNSNDGSRN